MRFAIYYAPSPSSQLHDLGSRWLGRDAFTGATVAQPNVHLATFTEEPRRYGFHATLKPPFALHNGQNRAAFVNAVGNLASALHSATISKLVLRQIDGFLALVPDDHDITLAELAAVCVRAFDLFRAPPDNKELDRRRGAGLSARQEEYLKRWGYPYVFDEFRFHITLTRRLDEQETARVAPLAESHFSSVLGQPLIIDALTVFGEAQTGSPFIAEQRFALQPPVRKPTS